MADRFAGWKSTLRSNPQASPSADTFNLWSVSLTTHAVTALLKGVNLRWIDWMQFSETGPPELGALYDKVSPGGEIQVEGRRGGVPLQFTQQTQTN